MSQPLDNTQIEIRRKQEISRILKANSDFYAALAVDQRATIAEIRRAARQTLLLVHPDKGGNEKAAKMILNALTVLSNPETRRAYDAIYHHRARNDFAERINDILNTPSEKQTSETEPVKSKHTEKPKARKFDNGVELTFDDNKITLLITTNPKRHVAYIEVEFDPNIVPNAKVNDLMQHIFSRCEKLVHKSKLEKNKIIIDFGDYDSKSTLNYLASQVETWADAKLARDKYTYERAKPKRQTSITVETDIFKIEVNLDEGTLKVTSPGVIIDRPAMKKLINNLGAELQAIGFEFSAPGKNTTIQGPYNFTLSEEIKETINKKVIEAAVNRAIEQTSNARNTNRRRPS